MGKKRALTIYLIIYFTIFIICLGLFLIKDYDTGTLLGIVAFLFLPAFYPHHYTERPVIATCLVYWVPMYFLSTCFYHAEEATYDAVIIYSPAPTTR